MGLNQVGPFQFLPTGECSRGKVFEANLKRIYPAAILHQTHGGTKRPIGRRFWFLRHGGGFYSNRSSGRSSSNGSAERLTKRMLLPKREFLGSTTLPVLPPLAN
jgi:hypothetical protein